MQSPIYDGYYYHVFDHYMWGGYPSGANPLTMLFTGTATLTAYYHTY